MIAETIYGVICISLNRNSVLSGKLGKDTPDGPSVELKENLCAKYSVLSVEDVNTSK